MAIPQLAKYVSEITDDHKDPESSMRQSPPSSFPKATPNIDSAASLERMQSDLQKCGYRYVDKIADTLTGGIILAESIKQKTPSSVNRVAIKHTSKECYDSKVTLGADGFDYVLDEDILSESLLLHRATMSYKCPGSYVCRFVECFQTDSDYFLAMEYINGTTLRQFVQKAHQYIAQGLLDKKEWIRIVKFILWQLVVTIHFLHQKIKVAHLDLTMDNIMVQGGTFKMVDDTMKIERQVNIKLIDFGLATLIKNSESCQIQQPAFALTDKCPQIFNDEAYSPTKADIWSLGMILFELMFGVAPYTKQLKTDTRYKYLSRGKFVEMIACENPSSMPVTVKLVGFLKRTLAFKEKNRADIGQMLRHSYLKSYFQRYKDDFESFSPKQSVSQSEKEQ